MYIHVVGTITDTNKNIETISSMIEDYRSFVFKCESCGNDSTVLRKTKPAHIYCMMCGRKIVSKEK
jgi:ribosomal protein S27E